MSWNLRPRKEQRIYIFEMPVLFFFTRLTKRKRTQGGKKYFLDVWYWEKGKFSYVREMIRAHFACNAVRAKKKLPTRNLVTKPTQRWKVHFLQTKNTHTFKFRKLRLKKKQTNIFSFCFG